MFLPQISSTFLDFGVNGCYFRLGTQKPFRFVLCGDGVRKFASGI